ncbi:MAG: tRNA pseudouridine(38-40) synthase TruA [Propionibacteriales bacterium]|nr:tRNA pseudouridine(38-40) synthase TruA [Propionibacteriales bacterium]
MVRLRLDVAYDGTEFSGWAAQPGRRTVQGVLDAALTTVLRSDPSLVTTCAGRTDSGVHARGQVCHVDVPDDRLAQQAATGRHSHTAEEVVRHRLAGVLPSDVRVRAVRPAASGFDARFSALWRRYAYRICDDPASLDPLHRREVLAWPHRLDVESMNAGATALLGEHDFAAFCRRREGATTIRDLYELSWERDDGLLVGRIVADAFCHNMVRALVGALLSVGEGRRPPEWPAEVLAAGTRDPAVRVVPAHGLTLEEVGYPADDELAARADRTRTVREMPT